MAQGRSVTQSRVSILGPEDRAARSSVVKEDGLKHAVLAVETQAKMERAMADLGLCVASAGFLATCAAHPDEIPTDEAGVLEREAQHRVLGSLALRQGGSWQH